MKNYLKTLTAVLLSMLAFTLVACGDDDPGIDKETQQKLSDIKQMLQGRWEDDDINYSSYYWFEFEREEMTYSNWERLGKIQEITKGPYSIAIYYDQKNQKERFKITMSALDWYSFFTDKFTPLDKEEKYEFEIVDLTPSKLIVQLIDTNEIRTYHKVSTNSEPIVGTWEGEIGKALYNNGDIGMFESGESLVQFRAVGSCVEVDHGFFTNEWAEINGGKEFLDITYGTWRKHNGNIIIKDDYTETEFEYKIKGDKLTLTAISGIASGMSGVFTRVSDTRMNKYIKQ